MEHEQRTTHTRTLLIQYGDTDGARFGQGRVELLKAIFMGTKPNRYELSRTVSLNLTAVVTQALARVRIKADPVGASPNESSPSVIAGRQGSVAPGADTGSYAPSTRLRR